MVSYPNVLARAQQEVDSVVGKGSFPSFEDQDSLPYINGLIHETLRYQTFITYRRYLADLALSFKMEPPCTVRFGYNFSSGP